MELTKQSTTYIEEEWFEYFAEECKAIIVEAVFNSRWALVKGYWTLGKRIEKEVRTRPINVIQLLQDLAKTISKSYRTFYYAHELFKKYPKLDLLPEGKSISMNKLITLYLPHPKTSENNLKTTLTAVGENIYFVSGSHSENRWDDHIIKEGAKYPTITRLSRFFHPDGI